MIQQETIKLDFRAIDDLAFAVERGRLGAPPSVSFTCDQLGPLLELHQLSMTGYEQLSLNSDWLDLNSFDELGAPLISAAPSWRATDHSIGLLKTTHSATETHWASFAIDAKRAAMTAGLPRSWASQMVAAMGEFRSNIVEHSAAEATGLAVYRSTKDCFEFAVSDCGVGLLSTLREAPGYRALSDHGEALRLALTEGASRYGPEQGRGYGFRPLFTGLANRRASLRFRTGSAALVIDGINPSLVRAQLARKARIGGFLVSVTCRASDEDG